MPAEQPAPDPLAGQEVGGRYRLIRRIGKGGMGVVYEAEHLGLDKRVAIKFLLDRFADDLEVVERFHREARTASRIGQENIIDVTDVGHGADGRPYIVMELLAGGDLATVLSASGPMPAPRAVHVIRQVLRGLGAAHGKGIVHRDMKPENVHLIERGGDPDFVKIMDFGISKVIAASDSKVRLTATGAVIGTPIYMAPEQALAQTELDQRVDLYAVGVMLYELLAGRPPFLSTSYLGLVTQHINTAPPNLAQFRPDLPRPLIAAVHRALEKDPAKRFQSAVEFTRALPATPALRELDVAETVGDSSRIEVTDEARAAAAARTPGLETPPARRQRRLAWIVAAAVVVVAAGVAVAVVTRGGHQEVHAVAKESPVTPPAPPVIAPQPPAPEVVALGKIDVRTDPSGAKVFVDDVYKGPSPVLIAGIAAGVHDVRLEKDGRQSVAMTVDVGRGTLVIDEAMPSVGGAAAPRETIRKVKRSGGASSGKVSPPSARPAPRPQTGSATDPEPATTPATTPDPPKTRPGQKPNPYE